MEFSLEKMLVTLLIDPNGPTARDRLPVLP